LGPFSQPKKFGDYCIKKLECLNFKLLKQKWNKECVEEKMKEKGHLEKKCCNPTLRECEDETHTPEVGT